MKILVPLDGSTQANAALDFVASRSTLIGQDPEVHLLNVQPTLTIRPGYPLRVILTRDLVLEPIGATR